MHSIQTKIDNIDYCLKRDDYILCLVFACLFARTVTYLAYELY